MTKEKLDSAPTAVLHTVFQVDDYVTLRGGDGTIGCIKRIEGVAPHERVYAVNFSNTPTTSYVWYTGDELELVSRARVPVARVP